MRKIAYLTDLHLDETFPLEHGVDPKANLDVVLKDIKAEVLMKLFSVVILVRLVQIKYFLKQCINLPLSLK